MRISTFKSSRSQSQEGKGINVYTQRASLASSPDNKVKEEEYGDEYEDDDNGEGVDANEEDVDENGIEMAHKKAGNGQKEKKAVRLTQAQISSLYRRLDINADGEVDLPEFLGIAKKLKLSSDPQFLAETFKKVDIHGTGKLNLPQFANAYNLIYDHDPDMDLIYSKMPSHVTACRYGLDKFHKKFIYEVYMGSLTRIVHKTVYEEDGSCKTYYVDRTYKGRSPPSRISKVKENKQRFDLDFIVDLIDADGDWNLKTGSNIMWWVDVSSQKVTPKVFIKAFSLPRALEPMFQLEIFDAKRSNRMHLAQKTTSEGDIHGFHHINSLNLFIQTMYMEKFPIVNPNLEFIYNKNFPAFIRDKIVYVMDKLAFFFTYDHHPDNSYRASLERADRVASNSCDHSEKGLPLSHEGHKNEVDLDYLLTKKEMKERVPRLNHNTLTLHLLDRGCGCRILLTFHRMEDESHVNKDSIKWEAKECAESGIIGRIVAGVRIKLRDVILANGVASMNGELADSSAALAGFLVEQIHNFTIGSLGDVDMWISSLEKDIQKCSVTKHGAHIKAIVSILDVLDAYVSPIHGLLADIVDADSELAVLTDPFLCMGLSKWIHAYSGDEEMGVKGTKYWKDRIDFYSNEISKVGDVYVNKLNEQRNSFTFVLSIFTIVSWPFAFLTGYWGSNHANIVEVKSIVRDINNTITVDTMQPYFEWTDYIQGINTFWVVNGVMYFFIVLAMLHFRIFYTAS